MADTELGQLLLWAERALCVTGLISLSVWAFRWMSSFLAKHKELAQVDTQIRATLREALELERSRRSSEREHFEAAIQSLERQFEATAREAASVKELLAGVQRAVSFGVRSGRTVGSRMADKYVTEFHNHFLTIQSFISSSASGDRQASLDSFLAALRRLPNPSEERTSAISYEMGALYRSMVGLETCVDIVSEAVPAAIEHASRNPSAGEQELSRALAERYRLMKGEAEAEQDASRSAYATRRTFPNTNDGQPTT